MPYLSAKISGSPSPDVSAQVAGSLADLTTNILRKKRELTSITVEPVDGTKWFVAGAPIASQDVKTFYPDPRHRRDEHEGREGPLHQRGLLLRKFRVRMS